MLNFLQIDKIILNALEEDMPMGDITTDNIIGDDINAEAIFLAKEDGVLAGIDIAKRVFDFTGGVNYSKKANDGDKIKKDDILAEMKGSASVLLKGERTALNILQRMSGIATLTSKYAEMVKDFNVKITDTRKTSPGLRILEKYSVRAGGGQNHRYCLSDGVLIKDNHIAAAGGIKNAVEMVRGKIPHTIKIEVECETMEQVAEALECKADIIMLDNMSIDKMKEAVKFIGGRAITEASGNMELCGERNVLDVAKTGVDIISVGNLTHTVESLDISMKLSL